MKNKGKSDHFVLFLSDIVPVKSLVGNYKGLKARDGEDFQRHFVVSKMVFEVGRFFGFIGFDKN